MWESSENWKRTWRMRLTKAETGQLWITQVVGSNQWSQSTSDEENPSPVFFFFFHNSPWVILFKMHCQRASLVVQGLRICLAMQGTPVPSLVWDDPTCHRATKPMQHNYWACALEPRSRNYWAHALQLLKSTCLEPVLHMRSQCNEKPTHCNEE